MKKTNSSMQLTRAADYAIRVMIYLAAQEKPERILLPELANATETPESFLSKVLQALARARLISSRRGKSGGFVLLPKGRQSTVREVIEAIDGPVRLNICLNTGRNCGRKNFCQAHPVWLQAQEAMMAVLSAARIADMAESSKLSSSEPLCGIAPALTAAE